MRGLPVLLLLSGCLLDQGRYIDRQKQICDPEVGCAARPWWPDADGDGWGDASAEPVRSADAPDGAVNNLLDCDDSNPDITADLGGLCPADFGAGAQVAGGRVEADLGSGTEPVEWLTVVLDSGVRLFEAEDLCGLGWGGVVGGPATGLQSLSGVWASGSDVPLHGSWAQVVQALPDGPAVWTGDALVLAGPETSANIACMRAVPEPADWPTYQEPQ